MCNDHDRQPMEHRGPVNRRLFLKVGTASALGLGLAGTGGKTALASNAKRLPPLPENVMTADAALERLMEGNARYVAGESTPLNFAAGGPGNRTKSLCHNPELFRLESKSRVLL